MDATGNYSVDEQAIRAAIERHDTGFADLAKLIDQHPDPQRALELANEVADRYEKHKSDIADLRAQQVRRIWEAEEMSLTQLGQRIGGLSKVRARQMVIDAGGDTNRHAKPKEEGSGHG